jgi:sulfite oxidase
MSSRRDFLKEVSLLAVSCAALRSGLGQTAGAGELSEIAPAVSGKDRMLVRSFRFLDLEMPAEFANSWITPVSHFYVRNHVFEPARLNVQGWRLKVEGEVNQALTLSLSDLARMEAHSVVNTLECAGNGRAFQNPKTPGIQWQRGAVGTARFSGPRLQQILERAGVKPTGKHVMFRGLDEAPGNVPPFIRSIPIEKAADPDTLIATHMNGAPLLDYHGRPARALVPGWIGAASVKWLAEIKVLESEFQGNFMSPGYRLPNQPIQPGTPVNPSDTHAITALGVKSIVARPSDGATLTRGPVRIYGAAWAGEGDIVKVEISTDGGQNWNEAALGKERAHYAWRLWSYTWAPENPGEYQLRSRATDTLGRIQPERAFWNPAGYLYNAIDQVKVYVRS